MKENLIEKIRSRGYWRINFQPLVYQQKLTSLGDCKDVVEKSAVRLRGWDYPHFPQRIGDDSGLEVADGFYEGWIDWENHKEFWRMYQSGQFLHYISLREDWFEEDSFYRQHAIRYEPKTLLNIIGSVVYQMTEIFEFLSRLARAGIYDEGARASISLNNTKNRKLWISDPMRADFMQNYTTTSDKIDFSKEYSKDQVIDSSRDLALEAMIYMFDRFGWHKPPLESLKTDQSNFLTGRI